MTTQPDFYTIGYSGRSIEQFVATLQDAGVKTLVDVRHLPLSRHKPDFSKTRLSAYLQGTGIQYEHLRNLGIPSILRENNPELRNRDNLWAWYDKYVLSPTFNDQFRYVGRYAPLPFAIMCVEADPLTCHRHRLALALERLGLKGVDL